MANTDNPHGLASLGITLAGGPVQLFPYTKDASETGAIFVNDLVNQETDGCIEAASITAGSTLNLGVNIGPYVPANAAAKVCLVNIDPNALYEAQDNASAGPVTTSGGTYQSEMGLNANVVYAAGSLVTGISATEININTAAVTAGLDLKLLRLLDVFDALTGAKNAWGPWARIVVMINNSTWKLPATGL